MLQSPCILLCMLFMPVDGVIKQVPAKKVLLSQFNIQITTFYFIKRNYLRNTFVNVNSPNAFGKTLFIWTFHLNSKQVIFGPPRNQPHRCPRDQTSSTPSSSGTGLKKSKNTTTSSTAENKKSSPAPRPWFEEKNAARDREGARDFAEPRIWKARVNEDISWFFPGGEGRKPRESDPAEAGLTIRRLFH